MKDARTIEELKDLGAEKSAPSEIARLYHRAFADYGTRALWNWREMEQPTITQALAIADSLRTEGNKQARALAVQIEEACRAAL
jgi:hypothetical protein